jgi:hypothetical protein
MGNPAIDSFSELQPIRRPFLWSIRSLELSHTKTEYSQAWTEMTISLGHHTEHRVDGIRVLANIMAYLPKFAT